MFKTIKTAEQVAADTERQAAESRQTELKQLLAETDYVALADYTKDKPEIVASRVAWREELDEVQETLRALAPVATKD